MHSPLRVLVGVDFSPESRAAVRAARNLVKRTGGVLTIAHVRPVSDIRAAVVEERGDLLRRPAGQLARDVAAYIGCLAGAISFDDYRQGLKNAGFADVEVVDIHADLNAYAAVDGQAACCAPTPAPANGLAVVASGCCSPMNDAIVHEGLARWLAKYDVNDYAASVQVYALKGR